MTCEQNMFDVISNQAIIWLNYEKRVWLRTPKNIIYTTIFNHRIIVNTVHHLIFSLSKKKKKNMRNFFLVNETEINLHQQLQYLSAVSVQSLWLWLTEVFVRLFITVWTHHHCVHSDSNNLLYLQSGLHWWSEWNLFQYLLFHCHWI